MPPPLIVKRGEKPNLAHVLYETSNRASCSVKVLRREGKEERRGRASEKRGREGKGKDFKLHMWIKIFGFD